MTNIWNQVDQQWIKGAPDEAGLEKGAGKEWGWITGKAEPAKSHYEKKC